MEPHQVQTKDAMPIAFTLMNHNADQLDAPTFINKSYFVDGQNCGSAATLSDGRIILAKPPGALGTYEAEIIALYVAAKHSLWGACLYTDRSAAHT